jgi:exopolysaccharide biosynthesis polyprenyl glycosylphosphotransferase
VRAESAVDLSTNRASGTSAAPARTHDLTTTRVLLGVLDVALLVGVWIATVVLATDASSGGTTTLDLVLAVAAPVLAAVAALHVLGRRWSTFGDRDGIDLRTIAGAASLAALVAAAVAPSLDVGLDLAAASVGGLATAAALVGASCLLRARHRALARRGVIVRPIVLIGSGSGGRRFANLLEQDRKLGYRLDAVIGTSMPRGDWPPAIPWYSEIDDIDRVIEIVGGRDVFVALEDEHPGVTRSIVDRLVDRGIKVRAWSEVTATGSIVSQGVLGTHTVFRLETRRRSGWRLLLKRVFDVVVAASLLVLLSPILAVAAIFIRREDRGPVLFRQRRVGRNGETFELLKLRTMNVGAEQQLIDLTFENERTDGPLFKLADDPRRTRVGRTLERLSIDELPQLWNVLRGDMSLVGPRPALPSEVATFDSELLRRHAVTPGITGLWQLRARDDPSFEEYRRLDLLYVEQWSLALDLSIFARTISAVVARGLRLRRDPEPVIDLTTEAA